MAAGAHGLDCLKFFPAGPMGGIAILKALAGPFPDVVFCPTGGVDGANAADYLALPNVLAVGGSWPASADLLAAGDFNAISPVHGRPAGWCPYGMKTVEPVVLRPSRSRWALAASFSG